jgi:hypothetical protein
LLRGPGVVHPGVNAGGLDKEGTVALILLILILAILLAGLGFAIHLLWWIALIVAVVWLLGFVFRSGERRRWYRW